MCQELAVIIYTPYREAYVKRYFFCHDCRRTYFAAENTEYVDMCPRCAANLKRKLDANNTSIEQMKQEYAELDQFSEIRDEVMQDIAYLDYSENRKSAIMDLVGL